MNKPNMHNTIIGILSFEYGLNDFLAQMISILRAKL